MRAALARMGESAQAMRGSIEAAEERVHEAEAQAATSDEAMVELAGMLDEALTCIDEQSTALVELAGMLDETATPEGE